MRVSQPTPVALQAPVTSQFVRTSSGSKNAIGDAIEAARAALAAQGVAGASLLTLGAQYERPAVFALFVRSDVPA